MENIAPDPIETIVTDKEIIHKKEFRIIGLSRSGNHAVINWIIRQLEGSYCFLNCAEPKFNPFLTARPLNGDGLVYKTNITGFDLQEEQLGQFRKKDYLLYNHEDCFLGPFQKPEHQTQHQKWVGRSGQQRDILILRDPFNLFASRIKAGFLKEYPTYNNEKRVSLAILKRIYKQHAREFLGTKNFLKNKVLVNFNSWSTDPSYREKLAAELGIPYSESAHHEVPEVAGGSSFDGIKFSGAAHKMKLDHRWEHFASDEKYRAMFDPELIELTRKIFGEIPALKAVSSFG